MVTHEARTKARVTAEHRGRYRVTDGAREYEARVTGKRMFRAVSREDYPAVGDWVAVSVPDAEHAVIHEVLPRRTVLRRKESGGSGVQVIAANVDVAFIVQAVGRDFSVNRLERYAAAIAAGGIRPAVILNKADLASGPELAAMASQIRSRLTDADVLAISTVAPGGADELTARLEPGKTYCFVGSSGVGKSSIINMLLGRHALTTGAVSSRTKRGRHITTARALFVLESGAMVVDNPGMREFGVLDAGEGIAQVFDAITDLATSCRFPDCAHTSETGCAVRGAVESGKVSRERYESFLKLKRENEFQNMTDLERRQKDRAFGKFVKTALKEMARTAHG